MYLTMDGGGSKLAAAVYDENFHVFARGRSGGVNLTQNTAEDALSHIRECLDAILDGVTEIEEAHVVFVGDRKMLETELRSRVEVQNLTFYGESEAGLLAGAGRRTGLLALSGTGSDVFWRGENRSTCVGGWGPLLGDQGSGTWIGWEAIRAVSKSANGWGKETKLSELLSEHFGTPGKWIGMYNAVNGSKSPFTVISRTAPVVAQAAREGDEVALDILRRAGIAIGQQMEAIFRRFPDIPDREITLCGGAWKTHPAMREAFEAYMKAIDPEFTVKSPWFEHVCAGPMSVALDQGIPREKARAILSETFSQEVLSKD